MKTARDERTTFDHRRRETPPVKRPAWRVRAAGVLGAAAIGGTLAAVRLWARLTRTAYHEH